MKEHSSRKLLIWVRGLYLTAGYLNALTLLLFNETAVGQTGRMTNIVYYTFLSEWDMVIPLLLLSGSFLGGAILGGFIFPDNAFNQHSRIFGWTLILMGIGLTIFGEIPVLNPYLIYFVCVILGIQNSLAVTYKGFSISSVVLTSVFSNFGVSVAKFIQGNKKAAQDAYYHGGNIINHIIGAILSILFFLQDYDWMILFISVIYIIMGVYYFKFNEEF